MEMNFSTRLAYSSHLFEEKKWMILKTRLELSANAAFKVIDGYSFWKVGHFGEGGMYRIV